MFSFLSNVVAPVDDIEDEKSGWEEHACVVVHVQNVEVSLSPEKGANL